jgi:hypothetical protein
VRYIDFTTMAVASQSLDTLCSPNSSEEFSALAMIINAIKDRPSRRILFSALLIIAMVEDPFKD